MASISTPNFAINPEYIRLIGDVPVPMIKNYQKAMSKAFWNWAIVTRQIGFVVVHNPLPMDPKRETESMYLEKSPLLGIFFFTSPVVNLGARDKFLNMPKDPAARGTELRHYAEMSICVAAQPIGWHWNLGKLLALLATTCGDYWEQKYNDELKGITTFSLWGRGSQYNRVYKYLGETKGHGTGAVSDDNYHFIVAWLSHHGFPIAPIITREMAEKYDNIKNNIVTQRQYDMMVEKLKELGMAPKKSATNTKMWLVNLYARASGDERFSTFHGVIRGTWYHPTQKSEDRTKVIRGWYERWGLPRYERTKDLTPPYSDGMSADPGKGF